MPTKYIKVTTVSSTFELGMVTGRLFNHGIDNVSNIDNNDGTYTVIVKPGTRHDTEAINGIVDALQLLNFKEARYINTEEK